MLNMRRSLGRIARQPETEIDHGTRAVTKFVGALLKVTIAVWQILPWPPSGRDRVW